MYQCFSNSEEKLAKKLCNKTFADYVMFQNSGASYGSGNKSCSKILLTVGKPKKQILCIKIHFMEEQ